MCSLLAPIDQDLIDAVTDGVDARALELVEQGIDVNKMDMLLNTPLHRACRRGRTVVVRALLSRGADPHAQDCNGNTPLHLSPMVHAHEVQLELIEALLASGADVAARNKYGETPLDVARELECPSNVLALLVREGDVEAENQASTLSPPAAVEFLENARAAQSALSPLSRLSRLLAEHARDAAIVADAARQRLAQLERRAETGSSGSCRR